MSNKSLVRVTFAVLTVRTHNMRPTHVTMYGKSVGETQGRLKRDIGDTPVQIVSVDAYIEPVYHTS